MLKISLLLLFSFSSLAMSSAQTIPKQGSTGKKQDVFTIVADAYEPYFFKDNATDVVCAKWGIKFCYFWRHNCVFNENAARDSLRKQIHITDSIAKVRFGNNWKAKFDKDVERELNIEKKIRKLLLENKNIADRNAKLNPTLRSEMKYYYMTPTDSQFVYHVEAAAHWPFEMDRDDFASYYRVTVNYRKKVVKVLSDSMIAFRPDPWDK